MVNQNDDMSKKTLLGILFTVIALVSVLRPMHMNQMIGNDEALNEEWSVTPIIVMEVFASSIVGAARSEASNQLYFSDSIGLGWLAENALEGVGQLLHIDFAQKFSKHFIDLTGEYLCIISLSFAFVPTKFRIILMCLLSIWMSICDASVSEILHQMGPVDWKDSYRNTQFLAKLGAIVFTWVCMNALLPSTDANNHSILSKLYIYVAQTASICAIGILLTLPRAKVSPEGIWWGNGVPLNVVIPSISQVAIKPLLKLWFGYKVPENTYYKYIICANGLSIVLLVVGLNFTEIQGYLMAFAVQILVSTDFLFDQLMFKMEFTSSDRSIQRGLYAAIVFLLKWWVDIDNQIGKGLIADNAVESLYWVLICACIVSIGTQFFWFIPFKTNEKHVVEKTD